MIFKFLDTKLKLRPEREREGEREREVIPERFIDNEITYSSTLEKKSFWFSKHKLSFSVHTHTKIQPSDFYMSHSLTYLNEVDAHSKYLLWLIQKYLLWLVLTQTHFVTIV